MNNFGLREKRLSRLGNSWALIIDRPMLHSLGFGPASKLRVHSDGHRLIVEVARAAHDPKRAANAAFAIRRDALMQTGPHLANILGPDLMERLGAGRIYLHRFVSRIEYQTSSTATENLVMDRLEYVRSAYATKSIEDAVEAAIEAVPG